MKQYQKLLAVIILICFLIVLIPSSAFAATLGANVAATIPTFKVTMNGQEVDNTYRQYPFIVYKGVTYYPMTFWDMRFLGISNTWSAEEGMGFISDGSTCEYKPTLREKANAIKQKAIISNGKYSVNGKPVDNAAEEYPILNFRDVAYFPLTWHWCQEFGWNIHFDASDGLSVTTTKQNKPSIEQPEQEDFVDEYGITDNVHLIYDIRTFTLFAFMNYTGYDDNNGVPITGVRSDLRSDLKAMDIEISSPNYFSEKNYLSGNYIRALKNMGGAPDFEYYPTQDSSVRMFPDLPSKLKQFYYAADIPTLFEKYRDEHEKVLKKYDKAFPYIVDMVTYFGLQNNVDSEFGIEVVLLDAMHRGSGLGSADQYYGYGVIRTGPSPVINTLNIVHEYAHGFVGPSIKEANRKEVTALSRYFIPDSRAVKDGYSTWESVVEESFVRAISSYFDGLYNESDKVDMANQDVNMGFVMTRYVYERIPEYETFDGDFNAFVKMLLLEYPEYAERERK